MHIQVNNKVSHFSRSEMELAGKATRSEGGEKA
jgi:hypothetical protein